ncbi:hypothetical protein WDU94_013894 [Cyamophila willieti]
MTGHRGRRGGINRKEAVSSTPLIRTTRSAALRSEFSQEKLPPTTTKIKTKARTSTSTTDHQEEIEHLRTLNAQLIQKLKTLEEDLRNTKARNDLLSASLDQPDVPKQPTVSPSPTPASNPPALTIVSPVPGPSHAPDSKPRLLVCGDSMVRGFSDILQPLLPQYQVQSMAYPGATLTTVLKAIPSQTVDFTKRDIVFVLAGSNNIPHLTPETLDKELQLLSGICKSASVVFSSIPYKFHLPKHNTNIFATNQYLLKLSAFYKYQYFECNFYLSRSMYTRHGLHFNLTGKQAYCEKLSSALSVINLSSRTFLLPIIVDSEPNQQSILDISCPTLENIDDSSFFLTNLQVFPNL